MDGSQVRIEKARAIIRHAQFKQKTQQQQAEALKILLNRGLTIDQLKVLLAEEKRRDQQEQQSLQRRIEVPAELMLKVTDLMKYRYLNSQESYNEGENRARDELRDSWPELVVEEALRQVYLLKEQEHREHLKEYVLSRLYGAFPSYESYPSYEEKIREERLQNYPEEDPQLIDVILREIKQERLEQESQRLKKDLAALEFSEDSYNLRYQIKNVRPEYLSDEDFVRLLDEVNPRMREEAFALARRLLKFEQYTVEGVAESVSDILTLQEIENLQREIAQTSNVLQFQKFRDDLSNVDAERQYLLYREVMGMSMRIGELLMGAPQEEHANIKAVIADPLEKLMNQLHKLDYKDYGGDEVFGKLENMRYHPENYTDEERADVMERLREYAILARENLAILKRVVAFFGPAVENYRAGLLSQDATNDRI